MSDIFLSYASADLERIQPIVRVLERQGWSVWWDRQIPPGKNFDEIIEEAIDEARCMIVIWSEESVSSNWVQIEASEGYDDDDYYPQEMKSPYLPKMNYKSADPEFVKWADEQIKLANMWDWGE